MASAPPVPGTQSTTEYLKSAFLSGLAITIPAIVTALVLVFAFQFLFGLLDPAVSVVQQLLGIGTELPDAFVQVMAAFALAVVILFVGITAESQYGGGGIARRFEAFVSSVPGIGSIYRSIDEISELLLESDTESFKEVKLVEYPSEGSYTIAFLTADTPEVVETATGHGEMVTLFMPMAPNPVMGGYVVHVSADRVYDVDMTVEEGIQSIVSSGVTVNAPDEDGDVAFSGADGAPDGEAI